MKGIVTEKSHRQSAGGFILTAVILGSFKYFPSRKIFPFTTFVV